MAKKKRCSFNWTWTSNVPTKDCADIPFPFNAQHLFKQIWVWLLHLWCSQLHFDIVPLSNPFLYYPSFSIQCSKPRMREPIFPPGTCMINVWTCNLYKELALRGVTYDRNSCMMKQESWFLHKLYNENFLSDGHWVTHKSWIQDASRRACMSKTMSTEHTS